MGMDAHSWNVKCGAMFIGLHAANKLARELGLNPYQMLAALQNQLEGKSIDARVNAILAEREGKGK